ncbi:unnamed protein product, partial [Rotaria sp. Silwood2]
MKARGNNQRQVEQETSVLSEKEQDNEEPSSITDKQKTKTYLQ